MKKLLLLTYYWPPAGGPAIQRILKFVKFLPEFGWQPVILTVKNGDYPAIDEGLVQQIPQNTPVYRTAALEPFDLYRKLTGKKQGEEIPTFVLNPEKTDRLPDRIAKWVRAKIFIPDARIGWLPNAVKAGRKIIERENIDLIFSSSPPHTVQLIAKKLAKKSGKPWVADFRDPWSEAFWSAELQREGLVKKINVALEKSVLRRANAVTTVSDVVADLLRKKSANRYEIIHNGFEQMNTTQRKSDKFILFFMGHHNKYQHREWFWEALRKLPPEIKMQMEIVFIGKVFDGAATIFSRFSDLNIVVKPYLPYREVMKFAEKASILFRPLAKMAYAKGGVGTKMFDYLALRKPILALGEKDSVIDQILRETGSGRLFEDGETAELIAFVQKIHAEWRETGSVLLPDNPGLRKYETRANMQKLAGLFDGLTV